VQLAEFEAYWNQTCRQTHPDEKPPFKNRTSASVSGADALLTRMFLAPRIVIRMAFKKLITKGVDS